MNLHSPVAQDFIWIAEYANGHFLPEFDFETKSGNSFYSINKDETLRFGLIGYGMSMFYELYGGIFKIAGQMLEFIYKVGDKEYYLTGQQKFYKDIISYKDAETSIDTRGSAGGVVTQPSSTITQFNFGYKEKLIIDDVEFNFETICKIPYGGNVFMNIWLVANKNLNGVFQIKKNGKIVSEFQAPLKQGIGGTLNWEVK